MNTHSDCCIWSLKHLLFWFFSCLFSGIKGEKTVIFLWVLQRAVANPLSTFQTTITGVLLLVAYRPVFFLLWDFFQLLYLLDPNLLPGWRPPRNCVIPFSRHPVHSWLHTQSTTMPYKSIQVTLLSGGSSWNLQPEARTMVFDILNIS